MPVDMGLRIDAGVVRRLLDLLAVLIGAGQEEHVVAVQPLEPRHDIGRDRGVGVTDMRRAIHIIDRGRDVEGWFHDILPVSIPTQETNAWRLSSAARSVSSRSSQQPLPQLAPRFKRKQRGQTLLLRVGAAAHGVAHQGGDAGDQLIGEQVEAGLAPAQRIGDVVAATERHVGQRGQQTVDQGGDGDPVLIRHGERPPDRAVPQCRQPLAVVLVSFRQIHARAAGPSRRRSSGDRRR